MAWLCLDSHLAGVTHIGLLDASGWIEYKEVQGRASQVLTVLAAWHQVFAGAIQGVAVVEGPGSFSAIRTGVLYANLYARFRHLPLVALGTEAFRDPHALFRLLAEERLPASSYVAPIYDQEPNITIPRT